MTTVSKAWQYEWGQLRRFSKFGNGIDAAGDDQVESGVSASGVDQVIRGANIPDWKAKKARGESVTTSLSGTETAADIAAPERATLSYKRKVPLGLDPAYDFQQVTIYGAISRVATIASPTDPDSSLFETANSAALAIFVKRVMKAQQACQSLVSLGELGETLRMIRHPLQALYNGCFSYLGTLRNRTKGVRHIRQKRQIIADTWLESVFGWQPLINDIEQTADAISRLNTYSPARKRVNSKAGRAKKVHFDEGFTGNPLYRLRRKATQESSVNVRYSGSVKVAEAPTFTTDVLGLSLRDLVPTIWELIPYSFLVDYFTNVGDMLQAQGIRRTDLLWVERGYELKCKNVHHPAEVLPILDSSTWDFLSASPSVRGSTISKRTISREAYNGGFVPSLYFEIPGVLSKKWLNIGALLLASQETSRRIGRTG